MFPVPGRKKAGFTRALFGLRRPSGWIASHGVFFMPAEIVNTNPAGLAAPGGHYSHAVSANGFVYISGQLPIAPDGTRLNDAPFERQARQVLDNVAGALTGAGSAIGRLVQVRVYVTD